MDHVADQYRRVARSFTELVEGVSLDDWDRPSPCEGWTARDVVGHLAEWVPAFFADAGGPTLSTGPSVDIDPVGAWHSLDTGIQDVLDQPALASRSPPMPTSRHAFSLSRAAGLDHTLSRREGLSRGITTTGRT